MVRKASLWKQLEPPEAEREDRRRKKLENDGLFSTLFSCSCLGGVGLRNSHGDVYQLHCDEWSGLRRRCHDRVPGTRCDADASFLRACLHIISSPGPAWLVLERKGLPEYAEFKCAELLGMMRRFFCCFGDSIGKNTAVV